MFLFLRSSAPRVLTALLPYPSLCGLLFIQYSLVKHSKEGLYCIGCHPFVQLCTFLFFFLLLFFSSRYFSLYPVPPSSFVALNNRLCTFTVRLLIVFFFKCHFPSFFLAYLSQPVFFFCHLYFAGFNYSFLLCPVLLFFFPHFPLLPLLFLSVRSRVSIKVVTALSTHQHAIRYTRIRWPFVLIPILVLQRFLLFFFSSLRRVA